jgi:hypothetical protein
MKGTEVLTNSTVDGLHSLRLPGMARGLLEQREHPDYDALGFEERLAMLVDRELTERQNRKLDRMLKAAHLRLSATIEGIDYARPRGLERSQVLSLAEAHWVSSHHSVYCKDDDRRGSYEHERFSFLGYTFRPRLSKNRFGKHFVNFTPAVSDDAKKRIGREIRSWRVNCRSDKSLSDLARMFNPIVQGWINYYGRFYKSMLYLVLGRINEYLVRWAMRK